VFTIPKQTKNLCNQRFGRLLAIGIAGNNKRRLALWLCQCDCGKWKTIVGRDLTRGSIRSCGCFQRDEKRRRMISHGESKTMQNTTEYRTYHAAKARCRHLGDKSYEKYGARGIQFRFESFEQFLKELGRKPTPKHSLDRIDNNGHYEPGNVRWATQTEQGRNTGSNRHITAFNRTQLLAEWVEESSIPRVTLTSRLDKLRWCPECAVTILPRQGKCVHTP